MTEILYFVMGCGFMLLVWSLVLFLTTLMDKNAMVGYDEWAERYDMKNLREVQLASPFVKENGRYYWWDECGLEKYGPYDTFEEADRSCSEYTKQLEEVPLGVGATKVAIGGDSAYCFITNEFIGADVIDAGDARFSNEFGAWISKKGQELLADMDKRRVLDYEGKIILREWEENSELAT
jgi:hypothetical protein